MSERQEPCRLVLIIDLQSETGDDPKMLIDQAKAAMAAGDIASIFVFVADIDTQKDARDVQKFCQNLVEASAGSDTAIIIVDDHRLMDRAGADGLLCVESLQQGKNVPGEQIARFSPQKMIGCGGIKNRHLAMEAAEANVDFLFIGRRNGDIRANAHPKNIELAGWCAQMMEVSVVVMGGNDVEMVGEVAATGADFVALGRAIFDHPDGVEVAIKRANQLLTIA